MMELLPAGSSGTGTTSRPPGPPPSGQPCGFVGIGLNILLFAGEVLRRYLQRLHGHHRRRPLQQPVRRRVSVVTLLKASAWPGKSRPPVPLRPRAAGICLGLIVAGLILLMGVELAKSSVEKILHPAAVDFSVIALGSWRCPSA